MAAILPFVVPALSAAQGLSTAAGITLALSPALEFLKGYKGRQKGEARMGMFGGTDFTNLPGGAAFEKDNRPGDIDKRQKGKDPIAAIEVLTKQVVPTPMESGVGEYQYPRVEAQTEREKETDRMVDLILNLPETKAEADAKVDYEALARENFRRNNPALESMPEEEEFLFNRYKRNLASKLAKQNPKIKVTDVQGNPEQAFLAGQLEKYLAEKSTPESNINRRRGF